MNELQIHQTKEVQEYELMKKQAAAFYQSGMFPDIKSHAQALVKVMTGKELGLAPFASITGIHIVAGKPVLGANLIATMIANHEKYNYRIVQVNNTICEIDFYENKNLVGRSSFTMEEANQAGLIKKDNWTKYPSDMLFARAISRGAKRYAPGIFGGSAVYTSDELGVETDEDGMVLQETIADKKAKRMIESEDRLNASSPISGSDEAIIEEFKETHVISEDFR